MNIGAVVVSLCGHDKGKLYVVTGKDREKVLLCDGKCKKLSHPKRKNRKHLKEIGKIDLSTYNPLYDAHIRKELKGIQKCVDDTFVYNY
ncbi:MAG: KOW domain-containing RNA-binding protein [Clostridia bacterium]|nr:KOW domain-containing RNA-binding protein [Clostridia bacterium]